MSAAKEGEKQGKRRTNGKRKGEEDNGKKVSLPQLDDYPSPLKDLFTGSNTAESSNFQDDSRQYNSAFSFASFGAQTVVQVLYTL